MVRGQDTYETVFSQMVDLTPRGLKFQLIGEHVIERDSVVDTDQITAIFREHTVQVTEWSGINLIKVPVTLKDTYREVFKSVTELVGASKVELRRSEGKPVLLDLTELVNDSSRVTLTLAPHSLTQNLQYLSEIDYRLGEARF